MCVYCSVIRSVLEYACAVWHPGFTKKLSQAIERAQKSCLKLLSYNQALNKYGLARLDSRHDVIKQKMFQEIKDPKHPLHYLLPPVKLSNSQLVLRPTYPYQLPLSQSSGYVRDFIPYSISKKFGSTVSSSVYCRQASLPSFWRQHMTTFHRTSLVLHRHSRFSDRLTASQNIPIFPFISRLLCRNALLTHHFNKK